MNTHRATVRATPRHSLRRFAVAAGVMVAALGGPLTAGASAGPKGDCTPTYPDWPACLDDEDGDDESTGPVITAVDPGLLQELNPLEPGNAPQSPPADPVDPPEQDPAPPADPGSSPAAPTVPEPSQPSGNTGPPSSDRAASASAGFDAPTGSRSRTAVEQLAETAAPEEGISEVTTAVGAGHGSTIALAVAGVAALGASACGGALLARRNPS